MRSKFCFLILLTLASSACVSKGSFEEARRSEKLGRVRTAIEQYETFVKMHSRDPDAPQALFRIGEIYRAVIADPVKARKYYRNTSEWYPQSPWGKAADLALINYPDYFPFTPGIRVLGDSQSGGAYMRSLETLELVKDRPERIRLKREIFAGEKKVSSVELEYEKSDGELREYSPGGKFATVVLRFPVTKGKRLETLRNNKRVIYEVQDVNDSVRVKAGAYKDCLRLREQEVGRPGSWKVQTFAPGAGLILVSNATSKQETRVVELLK